MKNNTEKKNTMFEEIEFKNLGLNEDILNTVTKKGFKIATEIQAKAIPIILEGKNDIIGIAQTGTGKTAAFGLPLIQDIESSSKNPKAIILAPTRELAIQVCEEINSLKGKKKLSIQTVYGGTPINTQIRDIKRGVDIVVGTPGRVLDMLKRGALNLSETEYFVLDEADEMLKMGFIEDIEMILEASGPKRRVLLFSATMPQRIKDLSKKYMKKQVIVEAAKKAQDTSLINQIFFEVNFSQRFDALRKIIEVESFFYGIIFCKTRSDVSDLTEKLKSAGIDADCIHGEIAQNKRERILQKFRELKINILVATDVAARGIDVNNLTHVINYSLPQETETYVHRIGRTGRAGNKGTAITFISRKEYSRLDFIQNTHSLKITKEKLPTDHDLKEKKQENLLKGIEKKISGKISDDDIKLAESLLAKFDSTQIIAALLSKNIKTKESVNPYESKVDKTGSTRLFIAKGRNHGISPKNLLAFIEKEARVKHLKAKDILVKDAFSFVTLPFKEAELILREFNKKNSRRPMVEKASN